MHDLIDIINHGGKIALLGIYPNIPRVNLNQAIFKGISLKGIYGREMFETWHKMVAMLGSGLDVTAVITDHIDFDDFESGFQRLNAGEACKVVMFPGKPSAADASGDGAAASAAAPSRRSFLGHAALASLALPGCLPPSQLPAADDDDATEPDGPADDDDATPTDDDDSADPVACEPTEDNIEGPFFREEATLREDLNVFDDAGEALQIEGRVLDPDCQPLVGAEVEVWHCAPTGDYDNESDAFEWRGRAFTDEQGSYRFQTVVPGRYLNGSEYRPAHVHYKVHATGHASLTTQLYFEGDPYNEVDSFIRDSLIRPVVDGVITFEVSLSPE